MCISHSTSLTCSILIDAGVCYMVLCEKQYSTQLAHSFLEDLCKEFSQLHGREVDMVEKNYAFLKFDTYIHKAIRVYSDTRTKRNIQKLKEELSDVQQIVKRNIEDIVGRREKLASMLSLSSVSLLLLLLLCVFACSLMYLM